MDVPIEQFKKDVNRYFEGNADVASWEVEPVVEDGEEIIRVGLSESDFQALNFRNLPAEIDGVKVEYYYTGEFKLLATERYDPIIGGASFGAKDITTGTLAGIVWGNDTGSPYFLTNEHVVSDTMNTDPDHPPKDHKILQPGPIDGGMYPRDEAGLLKTVGGMKKAALEGKPCNIDAALVKPTRSFKEHKFVGVGDVPELKHIKAKVGDRIIKSGRTTGVTTATIGSLNVSANIGGVAWKSPVTVEGVIQTTSAFVKGGDSGSRVWKIDTGEPIGIVFAGSWLTSLIIPAETICKAFNVTFAREPQDQKPIGDDKKQCICKRIYKYLKNKLRR